MARRKRPRRHSVPGMVNFKEADPAAWASSKDAPLFQLMARMRIAEQELHAAMDELAEAERRLNELPRSGRATRRPAWFVAASQREESAGDALEQVYQAIAQARAYTKPGLELKLRLLAELYGQTSDQADEEPDLVSVLIDSLIEDVAED